MARPLRIAYPGAIYHVTARGNDGELLFRESSDRAAYLALLAEAKRLLGIRVSAYVLMTNHVHIALETKEPNISSVVQWMHGRYAAGLNRKHQRTGHLFGGRFRSFPIEDDNYLLATTRYIHRNPVRAGLVAQPQEYPWSSYQAYVSAEAHEPLVDPGPVLELFAGNSARSRHAYALFVRDSAPPSLHGRQSPLQQFKSMLDIVADVLDLAPCEILAGSGSAWARGIALMLLRECSGLSSARLGELAGMAPGAVRTALAAITLRAADDSLLRRRIEACRRAAQQRMNPPRPPLKGFQEDAQMSEPV